MRGKQSVSVKAPTEAHRSRGQRRIRGSRYSGGHAWLLSVAVVVAVSLVACSIFNRDAPDATCAELEGKNACANGIIASCPDSKTMKYEVCTADINGIGAEELCEAAWQCPGAYRCDPGPECAEGGGGSGPEVGPVLQVDHVTVNDGPQGDGVLNPGETGWVMFFAKNAGDGDATNVAGSLSFDDARLEVIDCSSHNNTYCCTLSPSSCTDCWTDSGGCGFGPDISAGSTNSLSPIVAFQATVDPTAPAGEVAVSVALQAAEGTWDDVFAIDVVEAQNAAGGSP